MTNQFDDVKVVTGESVREKHQDNDAKESVTADVTQIATINRDEIDVQISTAHRFPRSITQFKADALSIATADEETAASCFYKLPRGEKIIEGPGIRLAEIVGSSWGNMRYGARIVGEKNGFIVAQGVAHDLEKNVSATIEVRRRITDKNGRLYNPDMIGVTANAACSIALRNAIFKVIPRSFVNTIYEEAKNVAIGNASTLSARRIKAFEFFTQKMEVPQERIFALLGKEGIEDVNLKDLELLTGLKTAIKDGYTTIDQAFNMGTKGPKVSGDASALEKKDDKTKTTKKGTEKWKSEKREEPPKTETASEPPATEETVPEVESDAIGNEVPYETQSHEQENPDLFAKNVQDDDKSGPGGFGADDLPPNPDN